MLYTEAAEEAAMARIRLEEVRGALTDKQWRAVVMQAQGYRQREIAAGMGVGRDAIARLLGRARQVLAGMYT